MIARINLAIQNLQSQRFGISFFLIYLTIGFSLVLPSCGQGESVADYIPLKGVIEKKFLWSTTHPSLSHSRKAVHTYRWLPKEQLSGFWVIPIEHYYKNELWTTSYSHEKDGSIYRVAESIHQKGLIAYYNPPLLELKKDFQVGGNWSQNYTVEKRSSSGELIETKTAKREVIVVKKEENVTVPAGTFSSCFRFEVHLETQQEETQLTSINCKGIGLVKFIQKRLKSARVVPGIKTTSELISYKKR
jgi:hypothetical protein